MCDASSNHDPLDKEEKAHDADGEFLIVGLGASAGGIRALKEFFSRVPADSRMAYVVILHLSPDHDSRLAEVLQVAADIPVTQVTERVRVEPNHVYVISPNQSLAMNNGHLALSEMVRFEERRAPVDIFFRTLAESHHARAVCVVLSGTGANGSMGLKRVKEMGGIALVQDPHEAEFNDMPRNSIATGLVDHILPVAEIPAKIVAYREALGSLSIKVEPEEEHPRLGEQALHDIFTQLRVQTSHDFQNYKRATVLRRIARRMSVNEIADLSAYVRYMQTHPDEAHALLRDLLISVTNFFRDAKVFERLEHDILPRIFAHKGLEDSVRVWVAGCATGEEAYSLAMLLAERTANELGAPKIQVFATDIDENAISVAREGYYTNSDVADISPERLSQYFARAGEGYRVRREIRETVLFAVHNVIKDPPFSHLDLATCRNLLIYLNRTAQARIMDVLHFALKPGGYLMLGSSESIDDAGNLYVAVDKANRIYQSRAVEVRTALPIPDPTFVTRLQRLPVGASKAGRQAHERLSHADLHQRLLEQYAPPSVIVNEEYDILHMSEGAGRYMEVKGGEPSYNLLKLVRPELGLELRTALSQAARKRANVEARGLAVSLDGRAEVVNLIVRPVLREEDTMRGFILVLFEEVREATDDERAAARASVSAEEPIARQLEEELARVKSQLSATVEQYELQQEELKASNEELQAINEELRSAAEELETSKEELQSINEELTTVNQELKIKIEEVVHANNDFRNLMNSTEIGTVFLDRNLRINLFTPRARDIFNLIPADTGRALSDITSRLDYDELLADVERVTERLQPVEREVQTQDGRWYLMRVLPYRTAEDRMDGVVITFLDLTERKETEERLRASEERLRLLIESVRDYAIFTLTPDGHVATWNSGAGRIFGYAGAEIVGQSGAILFTPEDRERGVPADEMKTAAATGRAADERWHLRKDGTRFYASGVMTPLLRDGELNGFAKVARDLTEQKVAQEELRRSRDHLEARVGERTSELIEVNTTLITEVHERRAAEEHARFLLKQVVTAQEDERQRIARDLHDHLGQQLTALRLKLESVKDQCGDDEELCAEVVRAQAIAGRLDSEIDYLARELRPASLDDLGLVVALGNLIRTWSEHFNIPAEFHTSGLDNERLAPEIETALYRIAQEALNNVYKHAGGSRADVILEQREGDAVLIIEDDGRGFDPEVEAAGPGADGRGMGLVGMRERAALAGGTLDIESMPGQGTTIYARVPVAPVNVEGGGRWR